MVLTDRLITAVRKTTVSSPGGSETLVTVCSLQCCYCWDVSYLIAAINLASYVWIAPVKIYVLEYYVTGASDKPLSFLCLFLRLLEWFLIPGKRGF